MVQNILFLDKLNIIVEFIYLAVNFSFLFGLSFSINLFPCVMYCKIKLRMFKKLIKANNINNMALDSMSAKIKDIPI